MEKIAREKLVSKIVCVALAIILWLFVLYQENPSTTKTVRNVPLVITGEQALKESGFSVYSISEKSVDVGVSAKRLSLSRLSNRTLSAGINVSSIKKSGTYSLPATVSSAVDASAIYYVKGKDIKVVIEPIEKATYTVEPDILAPTDTSFFLDSYKLSKEKITVTAPRSIIKDISSVRTEEFIPEENSNEYTAKLVVYGKNGKILNGAQCSPEEIKISYLLHSVKEVPVVLSTTGGKTFPLPSGYTVKIRGNGDSFEKIDKIETEAINLSEYKEGAKITVKLKVPKEAKLLDKSNEMEVLLESEYYN